MKARKNFTPRKVEIKETAKPIDKKLDKATKI